MTTTQWLFEYYALREKEKEEIEQTVETIKVSRKILINLLGLDLMKDKENIDEDVFMPLVMMAGRREVVESILEKMNKDEQIAAAVKDADFDALSRSLANDDGDMEPIFTTPISEEMSRIERQEKDRELKALGIKIVDDIPDTPHIKLNINKKLSKDDYAKVEKQIEEMKKKPTIKFDDNG